MVGRYLGLLILALTLLRLVESARAESEMAAGGAFMSSYTSDPYFDPRSRYSQVHSAGDIRGQPMLAEPGDAPAPCRLFDKACADAFERARRHAYPSTSACVRSAAGRSRHGRPIPAIRMNP